MVSESAFLTFLGIILLYVAIDLVLAVSLTLLRRTAALAKAKRNRALQMPVYGCILMFVIALVCFLIRPELALYPAVIAVAGSLLVGLIANRGFSRALSEHELGFFFLLPAFLGVIALYYYPIMQTFIYSLHSMKYTSDWLASPFIGLANYKTAFQSQNFQQAFGFTAYFTVGTVLFSFLIGLGMALATYWIKGQLSQVVRAVIVIPWAVPMILVASIWQWLLNSDVGPLALLRQWGWIESVPVFLSDPTLAVYSVIFADAWKWSPLVAIFLIGALSAIPEELYDSAKVDGAGAFRRFISITLPMIAPTIFVVLMFRAMEALRTFDIVYGMTGGGPGTVTETLSTFAYKYYFSYSDFGIGSAYAMVIFLIIFALSFAYVNRIYKRLRFR